MCVAVGGADLHAPFCYLASRCLQPELSARKEQLASRSRLKRGRKRLGAFGRNDIFARGGKVQANT